MSRTMSRMRRVLPTLLAVLSLTAAAFVPAEASARATHAGAAACPWLGRGQPVTARVGELLSAMTLTQKLAEMHAFDTTATGPYAGYEGYVPAQPSLCIPALPEQDDSEGVGAGATGVTQLPAAVTLSSAWDPSLAYQYGVVNGAEHWGKGIGMALGPGVNIQRDPRWGRNFEMLSEDPYLSASLGVPDVEGIQSQHVMADVKHFAAYNQETYRNTPADDDIIGSRTLHEIYLPAFYATLAEAKAASVMCSYASINGEYSCQDSYLLTHILGDQWGYQGFVRSDGGATHSTAASVNAGLDQEKGSNYLTEPLLTSAVADGQISMATINAALTRIFTEMFTLGLFDHPPTGNLSDTVTTPAHAAFARKVAEEGTVLLKNAGSVLPLGKSTRSIAVIGPDGTTAPLTAGGGSSHVTPPYQVSPLKGITAAAGPGVSVSSYPGTDPSQAAATAKAAQVAIVFASSYETEARDLPNITLQNNQDQLISAVAAANPDTIVVLNTGGPVLMPWLGQVRSVLEAWYPGQEDGNALAAVLFGAVDPAGHLPETFPASESQTPTSSPSQFPGVNGQVHYSEGLDVGYRWYDANDVTPLFPFGYGLSYTSFSFSHLTVSRGPVTSLGRVRVSATVTNTGSRAGSEVAQLYVGDPAAAGEPPRQLKGFAKVSLAPGRSARVHFTLTGQDLSYYDSSAHTWVQPDGAYQVYVGDSSAMAGLPLHGQFAVTETTGARHVTLTAPAHARAGVPFTVTATLTAGGNLRLHGARLALTAPAGWRVRPAGRGAAGTLDPGRPLTTSWQVTIPASAADNVEQLTATARYHGAGGTGSRTAHSQVTVDPVVTSTVSPSALLTTQASRVGLTSTDTSGYPVTMTWKAAPPAGSGITVTPASGTATLAPGGDTTTSLSVTSTTPGTVTVPITVSVTAGGATRPSAGAYLEVTTPYPSLAAAYGNVGITSDADHTPGNFDGYGNSFSAQALAAAGLTPGSKTTAGGVTFTWPDVPAGQPDNVALNGQTVMLSGSGSTLGFLGAAASGTHSGTGTIFYTDGTTQSFTIAFPDWISRTPVDGDTLVATTAYVNRTTSGPARTPSLFAAYATLQRGKTVRAVQLPAGSDMHVFALGIG